MDTKFAIKNAFSEKYLAKAVKSDKEVYPNRAYAFYACNSVYGMALFNTKDEAIEAYSQSNLNYDNEAGLIVEIIIKE